MRALDLSALNAPQREAVEHGEGPLLILAGAGSGKTRVITYRIADLIGRRGIDPGAILAVTFTNKAAKEMRERIERLLEKDIARKIWIGTFHALCLRILKLESPHAFSIYDEEDSWRVLKECQRELDLDEKQIKLNQLAYRIESAKHELIDAGEYDRLASDFTTRITAKVYSLYQKKLAANHAWDFGDLILATVKMFESQPEVLAKYGQRFLYVLVDEYQDINHSQYAWVRHLVAGRENLTVVGDDDQSIYQFRGADVRNILEFERDFPQARVVKLEQNYRSSQTILDAAWAVVQNNRGRKEKRLWTEQGPGEPIYYFRGENEAEEATFTVREIVRETCNRGGRRLSECVILYRTNAQSRPFEDALRRERIPYRIIGGMKFYDRLEIRDVLAYLKFILNPADELALSRIINTPARGLGDGAIGKIRQAAAAEQTTMFAAMENISRQTAFPWPERTQRGVKEFVAFIRRRQELLCATDLPHFLTTVMSESGYLAMWQSAPREEAESRLGNLNELVAAAEEFTHTGDGSLQSFLDQVALASSFEEESGGEQVTLMTLHSAKGLEFPVVFISGLEEGLFPHSNALQDEKGLDEERRLCYVGMTRARERLILTGAATRSSFGNRIYNSESRFLHEIPARLFAGAKPLGHQKDQARDQARGLWRGKEYDETETVFNPEPWPDDTSGEDHPAADVTFIPGTRVRHSRFGCGTVIGRSGEGEDVKVDIAFARHGRKQMLVRFAGLELLASGSKPSQEG